MHKEKLPLLCFKAWLTLPFQGDISTFCHTLNNLVGKKTNRRSGVRINSLFSKSERKTEVLYITMDLKVADEANKYQLLIGGYRGSAGDSTAAVLHPAQ